MNFHKNESFTFLVMFTLLISSAFPNEIIVKLTRDFINEQIAGHVDVCNFVVCSDSEKVTDVKKMSSAQKCLVKTQLSGNFSDNLLTARRNLFVVEMDCISSSHFLHEADSYGLFHSKNVFLLINCADSGSTQDSGNTSLSYKNATDVFENFNLTINSQVYLVQKRHQNEFQLLGLYKIERNHAVIVEYLNKWTFKNGFDDNYVQSAAARRNDLQGKIFNAGIVLTELESLKHADDLVDIHVDSLSKVDHVIMSLVVLSLNSSLNYTVTTSWGIKVNGKFDGMIGLIEKGEAELAVTQSFPTEDRMEIIEYIDKVVRTRGAYIFLSPPLSFKRNIFLLPFDTYVWLSYIGLLIIIIPAYYFANEVEIKRLKLYKKRKNSTYDWNLGKKFNYSWGEICMLTVASFCMQGYHVLEPRGVASRTVMITLLTTVIFLSVSYNAYIMVLLRTTDKSIISLDDLLKSNLELGVYNTTYNKYYYQMFQSSIDSTRKDLSKKVLSNKKRDPFISVEKGVDRVRSERYAFDVEYSPGYQMVKKLFLEEEKCRLQAIKQSFLPDIEPMLSIKKNIPQTEIFKIKFKQLHERGITSRIKERIYTKKPPCTSSSSFHFSIGLIDTHHIFEFLTYALFTSLIILIIEKLIYRRKSLKFNLIK